MRCIRMSQLDRIEAEFDRTEPELWRKRFERAARHVRRELLWWTLAFTVVASLLYLAVAFDLLQPA